MKIEIRNDSVRITGYVNVVGRDSRELRDASGKFVEQIAPNTFAKALQSGNPVELRFNHEKIIGGTDEGLKLIEDNVGLHADCVVTDPAVIESANNGELRGWSFGFVCNDCTWETRDDGSRHRTVNDIELREVSILNVTPAYIATSIETRGETENLLEFRMDVENTEFVRTEDTTVETVITENDPNWADTERIIKSRTVEIYKMKRR